MARSDFRFAFADRVRYAAIDAQGVVFNSRYLEYLDIGINEYWRAVGLAPADFEVHLVRNLIEYRKPLHHDELFDICVRTARFGRSSMTVLWEIHGQGADDLRAEGEAVSVHVDVATHRPLPVPDQIVSMFEAYEGQPLRMEKAA